MRASAYIQFRFIAQIVPTHQRKKADDDRSAADKSDIACVSRYNSAALTSIYCSRIVNAPTSCCSGQFVVLRCPCDAHRMYSMRPVIALGYHKYSPIYADVEHTARVFAFFANERLPAKYIPSLQRALRVWIERCSGLSP